MLFETLETSALTSAAESAPFGFHPENFVSSLEYMGVGMLGIFIIIGVIVVVTLLLKKIKK